MDICASGDMGVYFFNVSGQGCLTMGMLRTYASCRFQRVRVRGYALGYASLKLLGHALCKPSVVRLSFNQVDFERVVGKEL